MANRNGTMTSARTYSDDDEIGEIRFVDDFLPPPEQMVFRDDSVNVMPNWRIVAFVEVATLRGRQLVLTIRNGLADQINKRYG